MCFMPPFLFHILSCLLVMSVGLSDSPSAAKVFNFNKRLATRSSSLVEL